MIFVVLKQLEIYNLITSIRQIVKNTAFLKPRQPFFVKPPDPIKEQKDGMIKVKSTRRNSNIYRSETNDGHPLSKTHRKAHKPHSQPTRYIPHSPNTKSHNYTTLNIPRNTQIPNLLQHLLHPTIKVSLCILLSRIRIQILLHLRHPRVRLRAKPQLDFDQRFKGGVEIGYSELN